MWSNDSVVDVVGHSAPAMTAEPVVRLGRRDYRVVLPKISDPRLALAAVIISLQILGQTVLDFEVSITQILLAVGTCAVIEIGIVAWQRQEIIWPASAMQTGNGIGLIMRVPGTEHGDWWSTRGAWLFVAVAAFSVLSKYAIHVGDRHLFNPSNFGLVVAFVPLGTDVVDPQALWWGPLSWPVLAALAVIALGGVFVTRRAGVVVVTASFYLPFCALLGLLAASGHCMTARWSFAPVCGAHYWWIVVTSPEILVFILFMITDPRTVPSGRTARVAFGATIAVVATLIAAPQTTEFGTKVGILAALVITCALRPLFERWSPASTPAWTDVVRRGLRSAPRRAVAAIGMLLIGGSIVAAGAGAREVPVEQFGAGGESSRSRPVIDVPADVPITIEPTSGIAGAIEVETARDVAHDVLEDLAIEARAAATGDAGLAATALYGERLEEFRSTLGRGEASPAIDEPEHLTVFLVRGVGGAQAPPQIAVTVHGRSSARTYVVVAGAEAFLIGQKIDAVGSRSGRPI